jgi:hypothetical protein
VARCWKAIVVGCDGEKWGKSWGNHGEIIGKSWGNLQTIIFGIVTDEWNFGVFLKMGNAMACPQFRQV